MGALRCSQFTVHTVCAQQHSKTHCIVEFVEDCVCATRCSAEQNLRQAATAGKQLLQPAAASD
eukprot:17078-Heterococcus_DN1.PRE.3